MTPFFQFLTIEWGNEVGVSVNTFFEIHIVVLTELIYVGVQGDTSYTKKFLDSSDYNPNLIRVPQSCATLPTAGSGYPKTVKIWHAVPGVACDRTPDWGCSAGQCSDI